MHGMLVLGLYKLVAMDINTQLMQKEIYLLLVLMLVVVEIRQACVNECHLSVG